MPLRDALDSLRADMTRRNPLMATFGEYALRSLAASFVVMARKAHTGRDRDYYAARMEVMLRHHEVCYYRRLAIERGQDLSLAEPRCNWPAISPPKSVRCAKCATAGSRPTSRHRLDRFIGLSMNPSRA
jgi:hypothetical protein